ncbi:MAG: shikimate dehydrogenase [Micrococcales bacterium]|nr:shikimate dehydrogenase [Micrococcales bacterium]
MRRAAVLGRPVAHSLSPVLHSAAYAALGLDDWTYGRHDVGEADLVGFLASLDSTWAGLSLTMPLKRVALDLADHAEPLARAVGAANTLLLGPAGRTAVNTDVHGIVAAFREAQVTAATTGAVLGGGATAASALAALGQLGVRAPVVLVRSVPRAGHLLPLGRRMGLEVGLRRLSAAPAVVAACDVVVSTLPAGTDGLEQALDQVGGALLDVRYDCRPGPLSVAWCRAGGQAVGGERMLLHQAAEQVRLMTGHPAPLAAMDHALTAALAAADPTAR